MEKVRIADKLALFSDHFKPKIVGELNGQHVKLVKFAEPFVWHHHEVEDEMFLVLQGRFRMDYREADGTERELWIEQGEFVIMPHGVEHRPFAEEEVSIMLFEPAGTLNTGNQGDSELTAAVLDRI